MVLLAPSTATCGSSGPTGVSETQWVRIASGTTAQLYSVHFPSADAGYAVGDGGTILKTFNAGASWTTLASGSNARLYAVSFANVLVGPAGAGGIILRTTDGGTTWATAGSSGAGDLFSMVHLDSQRAVAVGVGGRTLRTVDGGSTWVGLTLATPVRTSVSASGGILFAVGASSFYRSSGQGLKWTATVIPGDLGLTDVAFANTSIGYCVGYDGVIRKTTDAGLTWSLQPSARTTPLRSIEVLSEESATIVGDGGAILHTTTGGTQWSTVTGATESLLAVSFPTSTVGIAVGAGGTIMRSR